MDNANTKIVRGAVNLGGDCENSVTFRIEKIANKTLQYSKGWNTGPTEAIIIINWSGHCYEVGWRNAIPPKIL